MRCDGTSSAGSSDGMRHGMSLVELLVVVAILGLLAVMVLPNVAATKESRLTREAARIATSAFARSQSRAIGRTAWAGFSVSAATANSDAGVDLFNVDQPDVYRGDTTPALLTITGTIGATERIASGTSGQLLLSGTNGANVGKLDLIRFDGRGPWYEISNSPSTTTLPFRIRGDLTGILHDGTEMMGTSRHTTPWPPASAPLTTGTFPLSFEILRRPVRAGNAMALLEGRCIDLRWSCFGPATSTSTTMLQPAPLLPPPDTRFLNPGSEVTVLFDSTGRVRQYVVIDTTGTTRYTPTGPLFLLIGRSDRAGNSYDPSAGPADDSIGANWQYPDSYWVAVDPLTGTSRTAECDMATTGPSDIARVIESQRWIRQVLQTGGR